MWSHPTPGEAHPTPGGGTCFERITPPNFCIFVIISLPTEGRAKKFLKLYMLQCILIEYIFFFLFFSINNIHKIYRVKSTIDKYILLYCIEVFVTILLIMLYVHVTKFRRFTLCFCTKYRPVSYLTAFLELEKNSSNLLYAYTTLW